MHRGGLMLLEGVVTQLVMNMGTAAGVALLLLLLLLLLL